VQPFEIRSKPFAAGRKAGVSRICVSVAARHQPATLTAGKEKGAGIAPGALIDLP
jgi:hypothetical protein